MNTTIGVHVSKYSSIYLQVTSSIKQNPIFLDILTEIRILSVHQQEVHY